MTASNDKWVALLRGVNVGGANKVPMAALRGLAEGQGWTKVRSYIASGNLVFEAQGGAEDLAHSLSDAMVAHLSVDVPVLVLGAHEILHALETCIWEGQGNLAHVFFCWEAPQMDSELRDQLIAPDERLMVFGRHIWLHAPSGVARSRLMENMERVLGVQITARNLNTLRKLAEMVQA